MLFKICSTFDSTDKGNIGPVMDALRADSGETIVLVTPAFPETGRTVYQGNLFVGSVPLNESPLKDHPLNPMHDSNLVRVLARQSQTRIALVDLSVVARGCGRGSRASCRSIQERRWRRDHRCGVRPRSGNHRHGGARPSPLGRRVRHRAWAGAGARRRGGGKKADDAASGAAVGGPAACLAGSCSQATLQQIANAEKIMPVLHLDPDRVVAGKEEARRALAWARERLESGAVLIASSATPDEVAALQARHGRDAAGHAIEQAMADIAEGLVQAGVRRLVIAGGETSGAVVDRLGIPAFLVGAEIAAGVPVLRAVGAIRGAMLLALKSGNFGGPRFFADALGLMR